MSVEWEQVTIGADNPVELGRWWCEVMDWVVVDPGPVVFEIQQEADHYPGIMFVPFDGQRHNQNRLHIDLRPDDQTAEVDRLIGLGATRADIGQGDVSWVVLADPEGNEFCVLAPRAT